MQLSSKHEDAHENYLRTIYSFTEWQDDAITPSQLAGRLGLAPSTVTEMVRKLAAAGLVNHRRYGSVTLTEAGTERALRVLRRHRLVETWLVREMGYGWDEVHDEAEVLEHSLSDRLIDAIADRLGNPVADPHGDVIPAADGTVIRPRAAVLADLPVGHRGTIVRIRDRDPLLLRTFTANGLAPGSLVTVEALSPRPVLGKASHTLELPVAAATEIWISTTAE